jgi:phosphate-selective porin OprO/OprP
MNLKKKLIPVLIAPLFVGLTFSGQALANDNDELEKLRQLVQELDQKVKILDRKGELADEAAAEKKKVTPVVKASQDGFGFESADGKNKIKFKALAQIDYRSYVGENNSTNQDGFDFRRIRPTIEGTLGNKYDFKFTPEFGEAKTASSSSTSGIVDAYVDARFTPYFQVRAGKFKPYVGLERLQSGADIKFIERSFVSNNYLPNRDLGVAVHGDLFQDKLTYALGLHNGVADGGDTPTSKDVSGDKEWAVRAFTTPFKGSDNLLAGLGFGIAGTHSNFNASANVAQDATHAADTTKSFLPDYKNPGQGTNFFTYATGTYAYGDRDRVSPQAYYYYGPIGVIAEYAWVSQDIKNGTSTANVKNDAWQIAGSWLITGEEASFKGVKPKREFDPDQGNWGAWEVVARYQEANIDDKAFDNGTYGDLSKSAKSAKAWGLGLNWYLNQNIKLATNYERTSFDGGAGATGAIQDRADEETLYTRLQLSY